jgi:hypothetical protein
VGLPETLLENGQSQDFVDRFLELGIFTDAQLMRIFFAHGAETSFGLVRLKRRRTESAGNRLYIRLNRHRQPPNRLNGGEQELTRLL